MQIPDFLRTFVLPIHLLPRDTPFLHAKASSTFFHKMESITALLAWSTNDVSSEAR